MGPFKNLVVNCAIMVCWLLPVSLSARTIKVEPGDTVEAGQEACFEATGGLPSGHDHQTHFVHV